MKYFASCFVVFTGLFLSPLINFSQPVINSITPFAASIGQTVIISGSNFDINAANNLVYFGAAKATVSAASSTSLSVIVPVGATLGRISVVTNNYSVHSPMLFIVVSGQAINANSFSDRKDFKTGINPTMIGRGDLDADNRPDMVISNFSSASLSVFKNTSSIDTVSFRLVSTLASQQNPEGIVIDDINGDGRQDIIVANTLDHDFSIFLNNSSNGNISFGGRLDFFLGNTYWPRRLASADMDGDGKTDIITSDCNKLGGGAGDTTYGTVSVSLNNGTNGSVSFSAPHSFRTGDYPRGIFVTDLDGDNKPDVVVNHQNSGYVGVFLNNSTPGNISLVCQQILPTEMWGEDVSVADFDGDGKPDLVETGGEYFKIYRNTGTPGSIHFDLLISKYAGRPLGISLGDINGDAKPDIAVANYTPGAVLILLNTSSSGNISFTSPLNYHEGSYPAWVNIGDVNGDNYPDLTITNITDTLVSILKMPAQPAPVLYIGRDSIICEGDSVTLDASVPFAQCLWNTGATNNRLVIKQSGQYSVKATTPRITLYDTIKITVNPLPNVFLGRDTLLCKGSSKTLNTIIAGATYLWNNGSTSSYINVATAGSYSVAVNLNGCIQRDTILIRYDSIPTFSLGPDILLCESQTVKLNPGILNASYKWQDSSSAYFFQVSKPGNYYVTISNGCGSSSDDIYFTAGNCNIYFPSAIAPYGNGGNKDFGVIGNLAAISSYSLLVYNRYGTLVFSTTNPFHRWSGISNKRIRGTETFVWFAEYIYKSQQKRVQKGNLIVLQ